MEGLPPSLGSTRPPQPIAMEATRTASTIPLLMRNANGPLFPAEDRSYAFSRDEPPPTRRRLLPPRSQGEDGGRGRSSWSRMSNGSASSSSRPMLWRSNERAHARDHVPEGATPRRLPSPRQRASQGGEDPRARPLSRRRLRQAWSASRARNSRLRQDHRRARQRGSGAVRLPRAARQGAPPATRSLTPHWGMSRKMPKTREPSKASLAEMPEVDFSRLGKHLSRGKYAARARRSLEVVVLDKKVVAALGGADKVAGILRALADAVGEKKPKKRRAA